MAVYLSSVVAGAMEFLVFVLTVSKPLTILLYHFTLTYLKREPRVQNNSYPLDA